MENMRASSIGGEWSSLPLLVALLILDKLLEPLDHVCFAAVCKEWRFLSIDYNQATQRWSRPKMLLPLLLVPNVDGCRNLMTTNQKLVPYSIAEGKAYTNVRLQVPFRKRCCGSSYGWLATVEKFNCHGRLMIVLRNSFRNQPPIQLPPLRVSTSYHDSKYKEYEYDYEDQYEYYVPKVILSADPASSPDNYVVVALYLEKYIMSMAFIRRGHQNQGQNVWTELISYDSFYSDIIFYKSQLYVVGRDSGLVMSFDIINNPSGSPVAKSHRTNQLRFYAPACHIYLVESTKGDLLYVRRCYMWAGFDKKPPFRTGKFKVYKAEFNVDKSRIVQFVELESIGDEAIFVGDNHSVSVVASNYPGCQPNCIYYANDSKSRCEHDIGIFNFEDKTCTHHYLQSYNLSGFIPPAIWVVPTFDGLC